MGGYLPQKRHLDLDLFLNKMKQVRKNPVPYNGTRLGTFARTLAAEASSTPDEQRRLILEQNLS